MSVEETTEQLYSRFKQEMNAKGYSFQNTEPDNEHYQAGLKLRYIIPPDIALKPHQCQPIEGDKSMPITQLAIAMSRRFFKHMGDFYNTARDTAKNLGQQLKTTEPMFSRDSKQVVYLGFK